MARQLGRHGGGARREYPGRTSVGNRHHHGPCCTQLGKYDGRRKRAKYDKEPVFGVVTRGGKAKTFHVPAVNRLHVIVKITDNVSITADAVYTDESPLYKRMPENVKKHESVNHSAK